MTKIRVAYITEELWVKVQKVGTIVYDAEYMAQFHRDDNGLIWLHTEEDFQEAHIEAENFESFIDGVRGAVEFL